MSLESTFVIGSIDGGTKSSSISLSIWPFLYKTKKGELSKTIWSAGCCPAENPSKEEEHKK